MFVTSPMNLCIFCYKSTTSQQTTEHKKQRVNYAVELFCQLLGRFVKEREGEGDNEFTSKLISCQDCYSLIREFCSVYHKIKCLELQLLWKLENLGNVMRLADRVPSRVKSVRQYFEKLTDENRPENLEVNHVSQDLLERLKSFRAKIINRCFLGRTVHGLQPHVLLKKIKDDNEKYKNSLDEFKSTENSNVASPDTKKIHEWLMSLNAIVYLVMSLPYEDQNRSLNFIEPVEDLIPIDTDNDNIQDTLELSEERRNFTSNEDDAHIYENDYLPVEDYNSDFQVKNPEDEEIEMEIKHSPNFNVIPATITHKNPVEIQTIKNKGKKLKRKHKLNDSIRQLRFQCSLCKTSYLSYGDLRKHKNNAFHRFLKKKTLKIFVNFGKQINNIFPANDKEGMSTNNDNKSGVKNPIEKSNTKCYNLRQTRKKTYFATETNSNNCSDLDSSSSENSNSSSETSDTDNDLSDIKPKIMKTWKRFVCSEISCPKSFLTIKGLQTHAKFHGNFPCNFCDKSWTYAPDVAYHENEMHTGTVIIKQEKSLPELKQKNKLKCPRCPKTIYRKNVYIIHFIDKHLGISTIHSVCAICQYPSNIESLSNHNIAYHFTGDIEPSKIPKCDQCAAYFRLEYQLIKHKKRVHNEVVLPSSNKCTQCGLCFTTNGILLRHLREFHQNENTKIREIKNKRKPVLYKRHQLPATKIIKFICSICALELSSGPELANHEAEHQKSSAKYVTCSRCKKNMRRVKYVGHFMIYHLGANQKHQKFQCKICESKVTRLDHHFKKFHKTKDGSTKVFKCEENNCKAYFVKGIQLIYHKRRAHNYNPLECKYCRKVLKQNGMMWTHIRKVHPDKVEDLELPVSCSMNYCKRRFETEADLEWHLKFDKHDEESGGLKCGKCGNKFSTSELLKSHMEVKCADQRNFICQICGKGFKAKQHLVQHLQFHKGPEAYEWQCQTCGTKFRDNWMLKDHMTSHTGEKKFICQWCGEKYGYKRSWKKHVLTKHKDKDGLPEVKKVDTSNRMSRKGAKRGECVLAGVKQ